jgi:hypothetical protein
MTAACTLPLEDKMRKMYATFQVWESGENVVSLPAPKAP